MAPWLVLTNRMWQKWYSNFRATLTRSEAPICFARNTPCNLTFMLMKFEQPQGNTYVDENLASHGIEATLDLAAHSAPRPIPQEEEEPSSQSTDLGEISCCYFKTLNFEVVYYTQEITETFCLFFLIFLWHAVPFFCRILHTLFTCFLPCCKLSKCSIRIYFVCLCIPPASTLTGTDLTFTKAHWMNKHLLGDSFKTLV